MSILKTLRSNNFAITVAILSVLLQSFHTFTAFRNTSNIQGVAGIIEACLAAIVVDLAILFYTVRGREDVSRIAAITMVIINVYFYWVQWGFTSSFYFGCFLSLIIPVSVYYYSEEINEEQEDEGPQNQSILEIEIKNLRSIITNGKAENSRQRDELEELRELKLNSDRKLEELQNRFDNLQSQPDTSLINVKQDDGSGKVIIPRVNP